LIDYKNDGKISKTYYDFIKAKYDAIIDLLNNHFDSKSKKKSQQAEQKLAELKNKVVDLLSNMGVNVDI
jgi:predicted Fe-Mo cluster-binding NifX family protein